MSIANMVSAQDDFQPAQDTCREVDPSWSEETLPEQQDSERVPMEKSGVYVDPMANLDSGRFQPGETVHMALIRDGVRTKGIFTIHKGRPSRSGYYEYQLAVGKGKLYNNGEWIRENKLKAESSAPKRG